MTPRIPLSLIARSGKATWISFLCLKSSDIVLFPVFLCFTAALFWSVIHTFLTTLMPTPVLPTLVSSTVSSYQLFKNHLEVMSLIKNSANLIVS
ncbi:MAG: hypothetical protein WBA13_18870 [Microcoleaceae cyanobacterium]